MRDVVRAIKVLHILDDAVASFIVEVDIDIRHADSLRVQEPLEEKVVSYGVEIGNAEAVGDDAASGASSSRAHGNSVILRPVDKILNYKEVVRESHVGYGLELEIYPFEDILPYVVPVSFPRPLVGKVAQIGHALAELVTTVNPFLVIAAAVDYLGILAKVFVDIGKEALVYAELREDMGGVDIIPFHLVQDLEGIGERFQMVGKKFHHLVFALQVLLLGVTQPLFVAEVGIGSQADKAVVSRSVLFPDEMDIVRGDNFHPIFFSQPEDLVAVLFLPLIQFQGHSRNLCLVKHHLQVVILSEYPFVPVDGIVQRFRVSRQDGSRNLSGDAGA